MTGRERLYDATMPVKDHDSYILLVSPFESVQGNHALAVSEQNDMRDLVDAAIECACCLTASGMGFAWKDRKCIVVDAERTTDARDNDGIRLCQFLFCELLIPGAGVAVVLLKLTEVGGE